jgi:hypothetical protein
MRKKDEEEDPIEVAHSARLLTMGALLSDLKSCDVNYSMWY